MFPIKLTTYLLGLFCLSCCLLSASGSFTKRLAALVLRHESKRPLHQVLHTLINNFDKESTAANKFLCILGYYFEDPIRFDKSYLNTTDIKDGMNDPLYIPLKEFLASAMHTHPQWSYDNFVEAAMEHEFRAMEKSGNATMPIDQFWNDESIGESIPFSDRLFVLPWAQSEALLFLFEHYHEYRVGFLDHFYAKLDLITFERLATLRTGSLGLGKRSRYDSISFQAAVILSLGPRHSIMTQLPMERMAAYVKCWIHMDDGLFKGPVTRLLESEQVFLTKPEPFLKYDLDDLLTSFRTVPRSHYDELNSPYPMPLSHRTVIIRALLPDIDCNSGFSHHGAKLSVYRLLFCRHRYPRIYDGLREKHMKTLTPIYKELSSKPYFVTALQEMYIYLIKDNIIVGSILYYSDWQDVSLKPEIDAANHFYNIFKNASDVSLRPALKFCYSGLEPASNLELLYNMDERCLKTIQSSPSLFLSVMKPIVDQKPMEYANFTISSLATKSQLEYSYRHGFYLLLSRESLFQLPATELLVIWINNVPSFNSSQGPAIAMDAAFLDMIMPSLSLEAQVAASLMTNATHSLSTRHLSIIYSRISFSIFSHFGNESRKQIFLSPALNVDVYRGFTETALVFVWTALTRADEPALYQVISRLYSLGVYIGIDSGLSLTHMDRLVLFHPSNLSERAISYFKLLFREREPGCSAFKVSTTGACCMSSNASPIVNDARPLSCSFSQLTYLLQSLIVAVLVTVC